MWERLDRGVASAEWLDKYLAAQVNVLECGSSDHKPILIYPNGVPKKLNKPWHFEQVWLEDDGCHDTVEGGGGRFVDG